MSIRSCRSIVCIALCVTTVISCGCSKSTEGQDARSAEGWAAATMEVELATVSRSNLAATVELVGSLTPRRRSVIVAEVDGAILEIPASSRERIETVIAGMIPIAIGLGEGSEVRAPMGTCVVGGLITSTLLTLVVVPVMYSLLDDLDAWVRRLWPAAESPLTDSWSPETGPEKPSAPTPVSRRFVDQQSTPEAATRSAAGSSDV